MDPVEEDLKIRNRKSGEAQWQEYMDQVDADKAKHTLVKQGPMAGRSVQQLDATEPSKSGGTSIAGTVIKANPMSETCATTAEKIESQLSKKILSSHK